MTRFLNRLLLLAPLSFGLLVGFVLQPAAALAEGTNWGRIGYAETTTIVFEERDRNSTVMALMEPGHWLKVDYLRDGWFAVFSPYERIHSEDTALGFVPADRIRTIPILATDWEQVRTVSSTVNIREDRTTESPVVGTIHPLQQVMADFHENGWVAVFLLDETGRELPERAGYVRADLLHPLMLSALN